MGDKARREQELRQEWLNDNLHRGAIILPPYRGAILFDSMGDFIKDEVFFLSGQEMMEDYEWKLSEIFKRLL